MALQWTPMQLPLANGLQQKYDARSRPMPALDICRDAQFDELGGLQTRYPFAAMSNAIFGGGTLSNCRRIVANGDELVLFTDTQAYSWNAQLSVWVLRGTHLAVAVSETPRCVSPGDQVNGDRAELNGTIFDAWSEGTFSYVSAADKTTGSVLMAPQSIGSPVANCRLVACTTTVILLCTLSGLLRAAILDPANPGSFAFFTVSSGVVGAFDAVKIEGQDGVAGVHPNTITSAYTAFTVFSSGGASAVTKGHTCDGPIALVTTPGTGLQTQVVRQAGTSIKADLLTTSTLADTANVDITLGTGTVSSVNQITLAYGATTVASVYWTDGTFGENSGGSDFTVKTNTISTAGSAGTASIFRHGLGIASRAFRYNSHAYLWLTFASDSGSTINGNTPAVRAQLQNSYFLFRDDQTIHARCANNNGGGFAATTGRLPGVALIAGTTGFAWCATTRRKIDLGGQGHAGFGARSLQDVVFTFDSNDARRCARLGATLYIGASIPQQYDGIGLNEVNFLYYPWFFDPAVGGAGNLAAGTYTWKATMAWTNAQGEFDRSTTATGMSLTVAASKAVNLGYRYLNATSRTGTASTAGRLPAIYFWRTTANPGAGNPFYLVSSQDPNAGIVNNGYVVNDDTAFNGTALPDNFADATLITKETNPENGAVLEYLAPPGAQIIKATDTRIFLAAVSGDPDRVWYSRLRNSGEVASFHDTLTIDVPRVGGHITAIDFLNDTLIVFRETAVYAFGGDGFDNTGGGFNYGPARTVTSDVGAVSQEAVLLAPMGIVFKSRNGWHLLDVGWGAKYIGEKVSAFDTDTVLAMHLVETQHHIRILTNNRVVIWDYYANQWGEWTIVDGIDSTMWRGTHVYLTATGPKQQLATYTGLTYGLDAELTWIKPADLQGAIAVRWFELLGEYRSSCLVRMRVARDYQYDGAGNVVYFDDFAWVPSPAVVGSALQVRHSPSIQKVEAFKVRITAVSLTGSGFIDGTTLNVLTSGAVWDAGWLATALGVSGNAVTMSLAFEPIVAPDVFAIDVRDHFAWNHTLQRWTEDLNNVGVKVTCRTGSSPTVAQLDAAISASSKLIEIDTNDTTPAKVVNAAAMANLTRTGAFTGGSYGTPTGEAIKLTGLALEVGVQPGLFRRLPAAQKA